MKKTLYEITSEALEIYNNLEENGGELTPEIQEQLTINEGQLQSKGIAYLEIISQNKSEIDRFVFEKKRLDARIKSMQNLVDNLESRLLEAVNVFGDFELGLTTITTRKSESIEVEDINSLPASFKTVKVVETADKVALKKAIKDGEVIAGVTLVENKNLRIK